MMNNVLNLKGNFLIAMPSLESDVFEDSLIYIFEHDEEGAVGIIVNQPSTVPFLELLGDLSTIGDDEEAIERRVQDTLVYFGGPVHSGKGFVLHSTDKTYRSTIDNDLLMMTSSKDVLIDFAKGEGPKDILVALGYAGWDSGQLEEELADNLWLTAPADLDIIFRCPVAERYYRAIKSLGFDPALLQGDFGHA